MKLFNKTFEEMDFKFLTFLLTNKVTENYQIEFKGSKYLDKDNSNYQKHQYDLAKKIGSFCNTQGGFIFFGVEEIKNVISKLSGSQIPDIETQMVKAITSLQPSPNYQIKEIINPNDNSLPFFVTKIWKSKIPVLIYRNGNPFHGTFPLRINEASEIADRWQVEKMFLLNENLSRTYHLLQDFFTNFKELMEMKEDAALINYKYERLKIISKNLEGTPLLFFYSGNILLFDRYMVAQNHIYDYGSREGSDNSTNNPSIIDEVIVEIKNYISTNFNLYLDD